MSKVKLVCADMDGTLLNAKKELSAGFYPIFDKMKTKGVLFAAASGRQYFNLLKCFESINDEVIFIAENGSYVVYKGEAILVQAMERDVIKEQILLARKIPGTYIILCGKKRAYVESEAAWFIEKVKMYYDRYEVVDDLIKVEDDQFLKIAICDMEGSEKNSYHFFKQMEGQLQVKVSGNIWLDISHKLANKGRAIEAVQNKYNISFEETMVFGDYLNDLEMMQQAHFSFAMENALPEIKHASRFMAKSNEDDGVTIVLRKMLEDMN